MKRFATLALLLAIAPPAAAQDGGFQRLFSGSDTPHTLKLKELNGEWKRLTIRSTGSSEGGPMDMIKQLLPLGMMSSMGQKGGKDGKGENDAAAAMMGMSLLGGMFGGGTGTKEPAHYSKGQTLRLGGETFLITYQYRAPETNLLTMAAQAQAGGGEPDFGKLFGGSKLSEESDLSLTLVNVKAISTIAEIRPFDLKAEVEAASGGGGFMDLLAQGMKEGAAGAEVQPSPAETAVPAGVELVAGVRDAFAADTQLRSVRGQIAVLTGGGSLYLRGRVPSTVLRDRAATVARAVIEASGAGHTVKNELVVSSRGRR
jgi:hypothetical protein